MQGVLYDVKIYQDGYAGEAGQIAFSDTPLTIDWSETDKLEPVHSASATLRLFSDTDRQFLDLYTVKAGAVRMDVYRDGQLYWSGTLDPELYEEPYSYKERYTVELTFSDFAILDRIPWSERGFIAIAEVIRTAIAATGIQTGGTVQHVSTRLSRADEDLLARIAVSGMNFFDEDDEPMTLRKVLEETLRPFALRIVQKAGRIYVYDLNALYSAFTPAELSWSSDDAILGADAVYNNVKVSFSPYGVSSLADAQVDKDSVSGETYRYPLRPEDSAIAGFDLTLSTGVAGNMSDVEKNLLGINSATPNRFSKMSDVISEIPTAGGEIPTVNSEIRDANSGEPGISKSASAAYFRITPLLTGSDDSGVAQRVVYSKTGMAPTVLVDDSGKTGMVASLPQRIFLCDTGNLEHFRLRLKVEMLVDDRLNPYDEDQQADLLGQDKDDVGKLLDDVAKIWYQKCALSLYPAATGGSATYTYRNRAEIQSAGDEYFEEKGAWIDPGVHLAQHDNDGALLLRGGGAGKYMRCPGLENEQAVPLELLGGNALPLAAARRRGIYTAASDRRVFGFPDRILGAMPPGEQRPLSLERALPPLAPLPLHQARPGGRRDLQGNPAGRHRDYRLAQPRREGGTRDRHHRRLHGHGLADSQRPALRHGGRIRGRLPLLPCRCHGPPGETADWYRL